MLEQVPAPVPGLPAPPWAPAVAVLDRCWDRVTGLRASLAVVALVALTVGRAGLGFEGDGTTWIELVRAFPEPLDDYRSNSVTGTALARLVGVDSIDGWIALHLVVLLLAVVVVGRVIVDRFPTGEGRALAAIWVALGSAAPALTQKVGSYDPYVVLGVVLVTWGRRRWAAVVGGVLIGATSAEQGIIGIVGAVVVAAALADDVGDGVLGRLRRVTVLPVLGVGVAAVAATRLALVAWYRATGATVPSRADVLGSFLGESLANAATAGLAGVYAWLGLGWGLVVLAPLALRWTRGQTVAVLAGLVALPAAVTVATLDGTRVFAMVSLPAYLVLLGRLVDAVGEGAVERTFVRRATVAALLAAPLLPALLTSPGGEPHFVFPF